MAEHHDSCEKITENEDKSGKRLENYRGCKTPAGTVVCQSEPEKTL